MRAVVHSSRLSGEVIVPPSKSYMQRACALALLHSGTTWIHNPGRSNDDEVALHIIRQLGATVQQKENGIEVISEGKVVPSGILHMGESGLSARMFTPIIALSDQETIISGEGSLLKRPMHVFNNIMNVWGVQFRSNEGYLPFHIRGPLHPADIIMDGSGSSQYLTGMLFALATVADHPVCVTVSNLVSTPYIDMSLGLLHDFGYRVENQDYHRFIIHPSTRKKSKMEVHVEGDWSQAAALLAAAVIAGEGVRISGLQSDSLQGDKKILQILADCFAIFEWDADSVVVEGGQYLEAFEADLTHYPDLFPPLVALAAFCRGTSCLRGAERLMQKESNRAEALLDVFTRMGVKLHWEGPVIKVTGAESVRGATVSSHQDHRIVMAAAIAGLRSETGVRIEQAEAVRKSYPEFFMDLQSLGAAIELEPS